MPSATSPPPTRIQISEPEISKEAKYLNAARRASGSQRGSFSNNSVATDPEEDPDHVEHKQDWTVQTKPEESWANRELRRASIWSKIDENNPHQPIESPTERRGSVLSIWRKGKDKNGRSILVHDGHDVDAEVFADEAREPVVKMSSREIARERRLSERRGSILSLWSNGKDANGQNIIIHDDEEWKV